MHINVYLVLNSPMAFWKSQNLKQYFCIFLSVSNFNLFLLIFCSFLKPFFSQLLKCWKLKHIHTGEWIVLFKWCYKHWNVLSMCRTARNHRIEASFSTLITEMRCYILLLCLPNWSIVFWQQFFILYCRVTQFRIWILSLNTCLAHKGQT